MGTPSAAAIAVSISARMAMLLASSSGSSSLRARLVQSRAALCASVVIIEGFSALSSMLLAFGSSQGHQGIKGRQATLLPLQPRPASCPLTVAVKWQIGCDLDRILALSLNFGVLTHFRCRQAISRARIKKKTG